jgi:hypothetical protein
LQNGAVLFNTVYCLLYVTGAGRETFAAAKARFASIKGACFTATMMHADRYSIPATLKGKRFHPLAIKAEDVLH